MSRTPSAFRKQDVERALSGADKAGCVVRRAEIHPDGKIILIMIEEALVEGKVTASGEIVL